MATNTKKGLINRYKLILLLIFLFAASIVWNLASTTIIQAKGWKEKSDSTLVTNITIRPERGNILADDGSLLAVNVRVYDIRMDLRSDALKDKDKIFLDSLPSLCDSLAHFNHKRTKRQWEKIFQKELDKPHDRRTRTLTLFTGCTDAECDRIRNFPFFRTKMGRRSMVRDGRTVRLKPFGSMASRSIGGTGENDKGEVHGISGLERALDSLLYGVPGQGRKVQLAGGFSNEWAARPSERGYDIRTTIDVRMQDILESELMDACKRTEAQWGTAVLIEVSTGEIKAISNLERNKSGEGYHEGVNHAVLRYEPGSVVKPISMMIALEDNLVGLNEHIATGKSFAYGQGRPISDSHAYNSLTPAEIIAVSSNIGMSKIILRGFEKHPGNFIKRLESIGLQEPLHIGIAGECIPRIDPLGDNNWGRIDLTRTSYGYRSAIPPIYTLAIYNAIANDGRFVRPRLVKELWHNGVRDSVFPVSYVRNRICRPQVAKDMREMLREVVTNPHGTGRTLRNNFVSIAGKTGTAYDYDVKKKTYDTSKKRLAFCGFFPAEAPKYSCIVVMYKANCGAARSSGSVLLNTALKMYARGMLGNVSDYRKEADNRNTPPTLYAMTDNEAQTIKGALGITASRRLKSGGKSRGNTIPSVIGMGLRDAINLLETKGIDVAHFKGDGYVYAQQPAAGTPYRKGTEITLYLKNR